MTLLLKRRPAVMLAVSMVVLGLVLVARLVTSRSAGMPLDSGMPAALEVPVNTEDAIVRLQERIRAAPQDTAAYAQLGWALLQRVRENGDASSYAQAEASFHKALELDPQHLDALTGLGSLALSRHQFAEAIRWGEQARAINPYRAQIYGIIADGQTELGRYDEAIVTLQKMVDTRPDLNSYSRVSYARELHGDIPSAIDAMKRALAAGDPRAEGTLWVQVQLGNLYFNCGDLAQAETTYQQALSIRPDDLYAQAGMARVLAAHGNHTSAIALYRSVIDRLPMPEFAIALGELYELDGQAAQAEQQYALVRAIQQLNASAGVDVDMELALFEADHGGDQTRVVAQARAAYGRRPTIHAAGALAWALYRADKYAEAQQYSRLALRLGTQDALLHYHAGMIEFALGNQAAARQHLERALAINPYFSIRYAPQARERLAQMDGRR
ncbi:MAG: tetratricopeptide repeat protein [Chloroflexi bacterium]|nr:tetratricopeptide repeat protein [Chloroflexota bacterium]